MFHLGLPELVLLALLALIVIIVSGRGKLPDLVARIDRTSRSSPWSQSTNWLLVAAAVLAAGMALSLVTSPRH